MSDSRVFLSPDDLFKQCLPCQCHVANVRLQVVKFCYQISPLIAHTSLVHRYNCVLWNCDGYTMPCICVTALYFVCVSVRVSEFFEFSHAAQTRGHPYKLYRRHSCNIMLDLRTFLSVSSTTCGTVCQQTVWIFPPLWHSNEQSNKLILRRFYLVRRLRFLDF